MYVNMCLHIWTHTCAYIHMQICTTCTICVYVYIHIYTHVCIVCVCFNLLHLLSRALGCQMVSHCSAKDGKSSDIVSLLLIGPSGRKCMAYSQRPHRDSQVVHRQKEVGLCLMPSLCPWTECFGVPGLRPRWSIEIRKSRVLVNPGVLFKRHTGGDTGKQGKLLLIWAAYKVVLGPSICLWLCGLWSRECTHRTG